MQLLLYLYDEKNKSCKSITKMLFSYAFISKIKIIVYKFFKINFIYKKKENLKCLFKMLINQVLTGLLLSIYCSICIILIINSIDILLIF